MVGTPRRGMVDRRTATLMYAGRNRRSAPRRKVPLTKRAPAWPAHSTGGDRSCRDGGRLVARGMVTRVVVDTAAFLRDAGAAAAR